MCYFHKIFHGNNKQIVEFITIMQGRNTGEIEFTKSTQLWNNDPIMIYVNNDDNDKKKLGPIVQNKKWRVHLFKK